MRVLLLLLVAGCARAQSPLLSGPGVIPARVIKHAAPGYPPAAHSAGREAVVVLELTIDANGFAIDIESLWPIGDGFDEAAISDLKQWRFQPATKDGNPGPSRAIIEVKFELTDRKKKRDAETARFNAAVSAAQNPDPGIARKGLETLLALAKAGSAPAQFTEGVWRGAGHLLPKDPEMGTRLVLAAAAQGHAPAVGQAGIYYWEGRNVSAEKEKGLRMLKYAAERQSVVAMHYLGNLERESNPDRAVSYFRRCAKLGQSACQTRLAEQLLAGPAANRPEAIAWLQLAARQNYTSAKHILSNHQFTPEEQKQATILQPDLLSK
jgi:TonB family protein